MAPSWTLGLQRQILLIDCPANSLDLKFQICNQQDRQTLQTSFEVHFWNPKGISWLTFTNNSIEGKPSFFIAMSNQDMTIRHVRQNRDREKVRQDPQPVSRSVTTNPEGFSNTPSLTVCSSSSLTPLTHTDNAFVCACHKCQAHNAVYHLDTNCVHFWLDHQIYNW